MADEGRPTRSLFWPILLIAIGIAFLLVNLDLIPLPNLSAVLSLWPRRIADFGDACLASAAKSNAFDALATFDTGFRKRLRRQGLATHW